MKRPADREVRRALGRSGRSGPPGKAAPDQSWWMLTFTPLTVELTSTSE
jgi:hypothetical protein